MIAKTHTSTLYNGDVQLSFVENPWHQYLVNGEKVATSTGVAGMLDKPGLRSWYSSQTNEAWKKNVRPGKSYDEVQLNEFFAEGKDAPNTVRDNAADLGTLTHTAIEEWILAQIAGEVDPALPFHAKMARAVEEVSQFTRERDVEWLFAERRSYSVESEFAGTIDGGLLYYGQKGVADVKTGKGVAGWSGKYKGVVYDNIRLQLASYVGMLAEEGIIHSPETAPRLVLHIPVRASARLMVYNLADRDSREYTDWTTDYEAFIGLRTAHRILKGF